MEKIPVSIFVADAAVGRICYLQSPPALAAWPLHHPLLPNWIRSSPRWNNKSSSVLAKPCLAEYYGYRLMWDVR